MISHLIVSGSRMISIETRLVCRPNTCENALTSCRSPKCAAFLSSGRIDADDCADRILGGISREKPLSSAVANSKLWNQIMKHIRLTKSQAASLVMSSSRISPDRLLIAFSAHASSLTQNFWEVISRSYSGNSHFVWQLLCSPTVKPSGAAQHSIA